MIRPYLIKIRKNGYQTNITIRSFRTNADISIFGVLMITLVITLFLLATSISRMVGGKSGNSEMVVFLFVVITAVVYVFRDKLKLMRMDRGDRKMIKALADFIWQNNLYSENHLHEIDYAIIASYRFEGTKLIISLDARGTGFAKEIQEKEISLQSLVPQFRLVDKRIFSNRTEYVFTSEGDNRIYVN